MKICIVQNEPSKGNISSNIINHKKWIDIAVLNKADLIVFPELSLTGYEPKLAKGLATGVNDFRLDEFQNTSDLNNITIGVGLPIKSAGGICISMVIFQPEKPRLVYSKQLLHEDEMCYFVEGNEQVLLSIKETKIALAICYESLQPEHSEKANKQGAEVYLACVAKPYGGIKKANVHFPEIAKKYAMPVLMSNSIGFCDNFESAGQTAVWDRKGFLVAHLDHKKEGALIYDTISNLVIRHQ